MSDKNESDYIRILSHQLNSPISAIQTMLSTILEGYIGEIDPKALHFIRKSITRAGEAKDIITGLLDYELYSHDRIGEEEEYDLTLLLDRLFTRFSTIASEKNISMNYDFPLKTRVIHLGNMRAMEHAVRNLIDNAIKYTPKDGRITVKFICRENNQCQISISDTGYGIPGEEIDSIFDPFYRSIRHKSNITGTGLGLAIVKRIIDQHRGNIAVESVPNSGATFTITLPYLRLERTESGEEEKKRILIIGGVTAGPKAAARLRRLDEKLDITIIEKSEFLSYSGCGLPFYISGKVQSPKALMSTADNTIRDVHFFEAIKNIRILNKTLALEIDRKKRTVKVRNIENNRIESIPYDILVLATGAESIVPDIPGVRQPGIYSLHNIEDAEAIKSEFAGKNARDVYIIGGGLIGIETAESLIQAGARVTILEKKPNILLSLMDSDISSKIENELNAKGIKILSRTQINEISKIENQLVISSNKGKYIADLIILSAGVRPNSALAEKVGIELGNNGGIKVDSHLQSSDKFIYAIGDCAESVNIITGKHEYWPLGSISTKMGRIAADNIHGRKTEFEGFIGTAMFKVFDINVARTGLTSKEAKENGFDADTIIITGMDRPHYAGNAALVILKVIADRKTGRVLGAQGYGRGDVISRMSIIACAITSRMTLEDVFKLDLGYSPAFNNPIDTVQTACLVLRNKLDGLLKTISLESFEKIRGDVQIIDVSPLTEYDAGSIPGSINIPLEAIRREEIPFSKNSRIVLYSKTSSGAYEAYRYLITKGYQDLFVLEGGFIYWKR
jgi:NADPH-dependent 2,4-dienoyl-CoA reductase/sulfur reductase-like enzyme/rhodanese-related sulfurtransferase/anti-sigma regulatory factor (Ser/Thr protein kinase)